MRILHVVAGAEIGGAETFSQDAIVGLAARGIAQEVVCRPWPAALERYAAAGVRAHRMGFGPLARFTTGPARIGAIARRLRPDIVHAWMSRAAGFLPAGLPCPAIGWFGDTYHMKYFRRCDAFIGVTPAIVDHIVAHGGERERSFLVNTFGTMPDAPPVDRAAFGTPPDVPLLLVLSRLHPVKGIDVFLRAMADLPGVHAWIAGEGPNRGEYEALARQLGLEERVRFLGWRNDRRALLEACDLVVLPSRYEPFGTVILEAWASHRPLVCTRADGARQYVNDGIDGLVCPPDDTSALAAALRRAVTNPALRAALALAGQRRYAEGFTAPIILDRLEATYRDILALGKRR